MAIGRNQLIQRLFVIASYKFSYNLPRFHQLARFRQHTGPAADIIVVDFARAPPPIVRTHWSGLARSHDAPSCNHIRQHSP